MDAAWGEEEEKEAEEEGSVDGGEDGEDDDDEEEDEGYLQALQDAGMDGLDDAAASSSSSSSSAKGPMAAKNESVEYRLAHLNAASRGEVELSGSEGDSASESEEGEEESAEAVAAVLDGEEVVVDPEAPNLGAVERTTEEGSEGRFLALVNLDWAQIRAVDIHALLQSCIPSMGGGSILRVTVYPSDYGLARMEEEARDGPVRLLRAAEAAAAAAAEREKERRLRLGVGAVGKKKATAAASALVLGGSSKPKHGGMAAAEEEEKDRTDPALVRSYELNKLKYYYAVAECDSSETAAAVYAMADGMEFGDSSNFLDLRFVPPGTVLKNAPRDVSQAVPEDYEACVMLSTPPPPPPLAIFCFVPRTRSKLTLPYNPCLTLCPSALSFSRERCSPQR